MYLINFDLYDLHTLIVFFRDSPERFPAYTEALEKICEQISMTSEDDSVRYNTVRNILRSYREHGDSMLSWLMANNTYTSKAVVIKDAAVYGVISAIFCEMIEFYDDAERFVLLCDAVHNVPIILADEPKPRKTIEVMIKPYRKAYNGRFLKAELKTL